MMKQVISARLGQQLTPQVQQGIKLMQLSTAELRQEVMQTVESNPMLELEEDYGEDVPANDADETDDYADEIDGETAEELTAIPDEPVVDVSWDDIYQSRAGQGGVEAGAPAEDGFEERRGSRTTLRAELLWQLNLATVSDRIRLAALVVIDSIDEDGMLEASCEELLTTLEPAHGSSLADGFSLEDELSLEEMEAAVKVVQRFDPPGVGARNVAECLLLQLEPLPKDTPWRSEAAEVIGNHFRLLANQDFAALCRRMRLSEADLASVMALIRSLNPRPGAAIGDAEVEFVEPDVVVRKEGARWTVELNHGAMPRIRLNHAYERYIRPGDKSAANRFLKDNLQDAKGFLGNLKYRNETLLKVAASIVERQRGFLERGEEAMQPLVLADVAAAVGRSESTISRVTTRKYMDTPRGVFELKYFFSSHVGTTSGGEMSSTAIRALIEKLIAQENAKKPLSDLKIAALLEERGIRIARRTVAKYREGLAIPSSAARKRMI